MQSKRFAWLKTLGLVLLVAFGINLLFVGAAALADYNRMLGQSVSRTVLFGIAYVIVRLWQQRDRNAPPLWEPQRRQKVTKTSGPSKESIQVAPPSGGSNDQVWQTFLEHDPSVSEAVERLSSLSPRNVEEFRTLLLQHRDRTRVKEFEDEAVRRVQGPPFVGDASLLQAYGSLNHEDGRLGDEFVRVVGVIGKPKDLERTVALVRKKFLAKGEAGIIVAQPAIVQPPGPETIPDQKTGLVNELAKKCITTRDVSDAKNFVASVGGRITNDGTFFNKGTVRLLLDNQTIRFVDDNHLASWVIDHLAPRYI